MALPAVAVIAIVAIVVTAGIEGTKQAQEISKNTDAWKALLELFKNCAQTRPDIITVFVDPNDDENWISFIRPEDRDPIFFWFVNHWYKSNELFYSETVKKVNGQFYSGGWSKVEVKEVRDRFVKEMNLYATGQASSSNSITV